MKRVFAIAIAAGLLAVSPTRADILNLDASSSGDISFTGMPPGSLGVTITTITGTGRLLGDPLTGNYFLLPPAAPFVAGPQTAGNFPIAGVQEGFGYTEPGSILVGIVTWDALEGSGPVGEFVGTFKGIGSGVFTGFTSGNVELSTVFLSTPSLTGLAAGGGTVNGGVATGAIQSTAAVPAPVEGAGWTGVIAAACVGLFMLARRRRFIAA
jgi:hypothetical protein